MTLDVDAYLTRIGYRAAVRPDLETLIGVHRAHLSAIPYENLDIHLGRRLVLGEEAAFDKLVRRRRGGWCYEMNGLMIAMLRAIGFTVHRASAAVGREVRGDLSIGNHLIGIVQLDRPYLVDVGFGDGPLDPIPLTEGRFRHGAFELGLERHGDWWRFVSHERGSAKSFDFTVEPREFDWFAAKCNELQSAAASQFTQTIVIQRRLADRILILRGLIFTEHTEHNTRRSTLASHTEFRRTLREVFNLDLGGEDEVLWPRVVELHEKWLNAQAAATAS